MSSKFGSVGRSAVAGAMVIALGLAGCGSESGDTADAKAESSAAVIKTSTPARAAADDQATPSVEQPSKAAPAVASSAEPGQKPGASGPGPRMALDRTEHDFGKVYDKNPLVTTVKVTNVGTTPLTINRISTSCGCTSTNKNDVVGKAISPGGVESIQIKYKPKATAGKSTKTVTIQSDDVEEPVQRFKISAEFVEPARLDPPRYQMGQIPSGQVHETAFYVISPDPDLEVLGVSSDNTYLKLTVADEKSDNPEFPGRKRIDVEVPDNFPTGPVKMSVTVKTKAAAETGKEKIEQELTAMILGHVAGELVNSPRFLRVKNVGAGEDFEVKTMLYSENGRPFKVVSTRIEESTLDGVQVETVALEPFENDQPGYWVIVRGTLPENTRGAFQGKVLVETDIPNESAKTIIFNGIIRRDLTR